MKKFSKIVTEIKPKENKNMSSQGRVTAGNSLPTDTGSPSLRSGHLTAGIWLHAFGTSPKSSKAGLQIRSERCPKLRAMGLINR